MTGATDTEGAMLVEWACPICGASERFLAERDRARRQGCAALRSHVRAKANTSAEGDHGGSELDPERCVRVRRFGVDPDRG